MSKVKNKISTTGSQYAEFVAIAAMSMLTTNDSTGNPQVILHDQVAHEIKLEFHSTHTSTKFINDSDRYSLDRLRRNKKVLQNLGNLKSNWNGYSGEPINAEVIDKTVHLISNLEYQPQIFPTGRGTIQIEYFKNDDNLMEIEISSDEIFAYSVKNGDDFEGNVSLDDLPELVSDFHA